MTEPDREDPLLGKILKILEYVAWIVGVIGGLLAVVGLFNSRFLYAFHQGSPYTLATLFNALPGISLMVSGLVGVAAVRIMAAIKRTAVNSRQIHETLDRMEKSAGGTGGSDTPPPPPQPPELTLEPTFEEKYPYFFNYLGHDIRYK